MCATFDAVCLGILIEDPLEMFRRREKDVQSWGDGLACLRILRVSSLGMEEVVPISVSQSKACINMHSLKYEVKANGYHFSL